MKLDVYFTPGELGPIELPERVVVVDVLRATSTIVEALANGARAVFPVGSADDAARIGQNLGRDSVLLCGERNGLPIEGFDLGNSPSEFTAEAVEGLPLAMATSNGTRAFTAVAERRGAQADGETEVLAGAFLNLTAVAEALAEGAAGDRGAAIVCAARDGRFGLDDAICAGALIKAVKGLGAEPVLNDAGAAARSLVGRQERFDRALADTAAGRYLCEIGREDDVAFCAQVDRTTIVPRFRDKKITAQ